MSVNTKFSVHLPREGSLHSPIIIIIITITIIIIIIIIIIITIILLF